ncbi:response regulator transcription factor [Enterocloster bolteae]|uniref:response regulator transcription factor n=1 Tax=Enterocloster bolteae TaxID=208479 RepID=UPI0028DC1A4A|nr:response regulator transcription factor [Enterocloster bolteae]
MNKVLIVEDDTLIAELERDYLEASGFEVELVFDGDTGLKLALAGGWDALILDVMLPGKNGFEVCREVRKSLNLPVLMVTAKKEDVDKIRGLGLGADGYLVKPFSPAELVARVRSHIQIHERLLAHREVQRDNGIKIKNLTILPKSRRVYLNEEEMSLANKEFELLLFLAENPNIVFSKDTLFDRIWGMDSVGNTATVTVHINRLREKLEREENSPQFIETVWGAGYRFRVDDL